MFSILFPTTDKVFLPFGIFTLFYGMAEFSHGIGQVGVFLRGGGAVTFVLVHVFVGGFQISSDVA